MPVSRFADEVLARMRLDDLQVPITRREQFRHLPRLGPIDWVRFVGDHGAQEIGTALRGPDREEPRPVRQRTAEQS
ncbi:hypothetical protein GCM10020221_01600 [Streptomyces thioluteus]|uniref:Uncharacterized protein n=1 Tax=Streptomyces thioluteus TaxID=66431 RepID=A0ABN3WDJ6_STRTU